MRVLEFFCGGGMVRAGLDFDDEVVFANDFSPLKVQTYTRNWGGEHLQAGDVAAVRADQLPSADLAWASSPCQDVSLAGAGAGFGTAEQRTRSGTWWTFWALIETLAAEGRAPRAVVLENVLGLLTNRGGADLQLVCAAMARAGYTVGAVVIDAALFLPHSRPRVFVLALRGPLPAWTPGPDPHWHPAALQAVYAGLDESTRAAWHWWTPQRPTAAVPTLASLLEDSPWFQGERAAAALAQLSARSRAALTLPGDVLATGWRRTRQGQVQLELRFDGLSGCLRTAGGGSSRQVIVQRHGGALRVRLMTPREGARLMGLPDGYELPSTQTDAFHVIGDGVAVPVVRFLRAYLRAVGF